MLCPACNVILYEKVAFYSLFMTKNYEYLIFAGFHKDIESVMTEEVIGVIMNKYKEVLSVKKRSLIINYLLSKKQLLKTVYMGGIL